VNEHRVLINLLTHCNNITNYLKLTNLQDNKGYYQHYPTFTIKSHYQTC